MVQLLLDANEQPVTEGLLTKFMNELRYLGQVALGFLTLNQQIVTSSGEGTKKTTLVTALDNTLSGACTFSVGSKCRHKNNSEYAVDDQNLTRTYSNSATWLYGSGSGLLFSFTKAALGAYIKE